MGFSISGPITGNSSTKDIANALNDLSEKFETLKTKIITVEHKYSTQVNLENYFSFILNSSLV